MNFAFTEEQEELRKTVRQFLEAKSSEEAVREQMETTDGYDAAVWSQMGEQMGLQGLAIPEEFGGSGYSFVELGIVLEEMGRALLCAPYYSTVVLAASTLLQSGDSAAKKAYLPGIASGETIATLAYTEPSGKWDASGITMSAAGSGSDFKLTGTKMFVLDGHVANLIIVAAKTGKGISLFAVDGKASGLTRTALSTMDQTRKQAKLEFNNTPAKLIGTIELPSIGVKESMYEGVTMPTLNRGPGHWPGSAMPGRKGNVVIAGHRVSHTHPFRDLDKLKPGDPVVFTVGTGRYVYLVDHTKIVSPYDLYILEQTPAKTATLFACHPKGSTKQRIVVFLKYAPSQSQPAV